MQPWGVEDAFLFLDFNDQRMKVTDYSATSNGEWSQGLGKPVQGVWLE